MVIYSLKPSTEGRWHVCRSGVSLFGDLRLEAAVRLAREVARDEHFRCGRTVYVEMPGPESTIRLARFAPAALRGKAACPDRFAHDAESGTACVWRAG